MRAVLFFLILAVVAALIAVQTGLVDVNMTRPATPPTVTAEDGRVSARPGTAPAFDVETGSVAVGKTERQVTVPTVEVRPPDGDVPANGTAPAAR